jgi:beta-barrel assembly-enhancing protease
MIRRLNRTSRTPATRAAAALVAIVSSASLAFGQTKVVAPDNKYNVSEDVKLGREAAREVEEQMPLLREETVQEYIERIGERLVENIPAEFRHPEFRYSFKVVNASDINAFALPGGPMYVNRGMIEAAKTEGEVAGVMAHELSHVALRHGTAQAGKAAPFEIGSVLGQIAGAVIGGGLGQVVSGVTQFGLGTAFLKYGREYEKQADILGTQIMARAGYDPRDMANMFKTIQAKSGNGGPQWMSSHPNPSNRYEYITAEANMLQVSNPIRITQGFTDVKARLARMAPAQTMEQIARQGQGGRGQGGQQGGGYPSSAQIGQVERPSTRYQSYEEGNLFRISVPSNWRELPSNTTVTFAPEGGYGNSQNQSVFTHGVQVGVEQGDGQNLRTATTDLIQSLRQGNPRIRQSGQFSNVTIGGRPGLSTLLSNVSDATGQQERIALYTALLSDGSLFYVVGVAPASEFQRYQPVFNQVVRSIELKDTVRNSSF